MQALAPFLTGLGLFFCGVHFLSANLVPLAGRRLRVLLTRFGKRVSIAALFGVLAGVVTQSTNAVTSVIIGLVSGGMVDKRRATLIPIWSHVGTSALVILVAIDFRLAASYLLALAGIAVYFGLDRNDRVRNAVGTVLGIGMLFIGMQMLKSGTAPLSEGLIHSGTFALMVKHPAVLLAMGATLSLVCQSSSVAGALAVASAGAGLVDLSGACWLVYGANLGAGANYALLAKTHRGEAAQIAWMQVAQKILGFAAFAAIMAYELASNMNVIEDGARALATTMSGQVAWVFLATQVAGSSLATLLFPWLIPLVERMAPPSELQALGKPAFLIDDALVEPSFAIELVGREERRLLERLPAMLDTVRADTEGPATEPKTLRSAGALITGAMAGYLGSILGSNLERSDREQAVRLEHRTANLTAIYEGLDEFVTACKTSRQWPSSGRVADQMIESLHTLLSALVEATASDDPAEREFVLSLLGQRDELMERIRQRVLRENPDMPPKAQDAIFAATMLFERIIWLARRSALLLAPAAA